MKATEKAHALCQEMERRMQAMSVVTTAHYDAGAALIAEALESAWAEGHADGLLYGHERINELEAQLKERRP